VGPTRRMLSWIAGARGRCDGCRTYQAGLEGGRQIGRFGSPSLTESVTQNSFEDAASHRCGRRPICLIAYTFY
jgi:hypothetical protein